MIFLSFLWLILTILLCISAKIPIMLLSVTEEKSFYIEGDKISLEIYIEENLINLQKNILESSSRIMAGYEDQKID